MKTYYLTSFWKYYSLLSGCSLFWFILAAIAYQGKHLDFVFLAALLGLVDAVQPFYDVSTPRIIISKNGVEWHSLGFTLLARWENVEKISRRFYGFSLQEGLNITKLSLRITKTGVGYLPTPWQIPPVRPFIPLSCFGDNWRDSELGVQIKYHAPHLFENPSSLRAPRAERSECKSSEDEA